MIRQKLHTLSIGLVISLMSSIVAPTSVYSADSSEYFSYSGDNNIEGTKKFLKFLKDNGLDAKYIDDETLRIEFDGTAFITTPKFSKPRTEKISNNQSFTFKSSLDRILMDIYIETLPLSSSQLIQLKEKIAKINIDKVYKVHYGDNYITMHGYTTFVDVLSFNELLHSLHAYGLMRVFTTADLLDYLK